MHCLDEKLELYFIIKIRFAPVIQVPIKLLDIQTIQLMQLYQISYSILILQSLINLLYD